MDGEELVGRSLVRQEGDGAGVGADGVVAGEAVVERKPDARLDQQQAEEVRRGDVGEERELVGDLFEEGGGLVLPRDLAGDKSGKSGGVGLGKSSDEVAYLLFAGRRGEEHKELEELLVLRGVMRRAGN